MRTVLTSCLLAVTASSQVRWESVPPRFLAVPGNAGVSMPVRWDQGLMQVVVDGPLVQGALRTQPIVRLRLRRSVFDEPAALAGKTSVCELRLGDTPLLARRVTRTFATNRNAATLTTVFAGRPVAVPAQPALGPATLVGGDLLDLPLDAPFAFAGPNLLVECEAQGAAPGVSPGYSVDAVLTGTADRGTWTTLGVGGCGPRPPRNVLAAAADFAPALGQPLQLTLTDSTPLASGVLLVGIDPERRPPFGLPLGTSLGLLGAPTCHLWAGADITVPVAVRSNGTASISTPLPDRPRLQGIRLSAQVVILPGTALQTSNGVLLHTGTTGVGDQAASLFAYLPNAPETPWTPFFGLVPVLLAGY